MTTEFLPGDKVKIIDRKYKEQYFRSGPDILTIKKIWDGDCPTAEFVESKVWADVRRLEKC